MKPDVLAACILDAMQANSSTGMYITRARDNGGDWTYQRVTIDGTTDMLAVAAEILSTDWER